MLIKNGFLIDPATKKSGNYDIRIKNGIITEIENTLSPAPNEQVTDAAGLTVAPGLIDTHIHFRDPGFTYKENIHTGSQAAAAGGFTSVICMANTSPVVDNTETLTDILERAKDEKIHVYQAASVSHKLRGEEMTDMEALKTAGACGFTDDGIPLKNAAFLYEAMEKSKQLNVPISLHEEDPSFIKNNGVNHGAVSEQLGIYGSPSIAEESLVARDCMIALHSGADVVMQHISSGRSVDIIRHFKSLGANIHTEATPHHFTLTDEAVLTYGTLAKMNPPLRSKADVEALREGLKNNIMDVIATDHAPHAEQEKDKSMKDAAFGIVGLETSAALTYTELVETGVLTPMQMAEKMSYNPAKILGLSEEKGSISEGKIADIVIFDPSKEYEIDKHTFFSKGKNTPFHGKKVKGEVRCTIVDGVPVYEG